MHASVSSVSSTYKCHRCRPRPIVKVDAPSRGCIVESEDEEDKDEDDITTTTSLNSKYGGYGSNLHRNADRVLM